MLGVRTLGGGGQLGGRGWAEVGFPRLGWEGDERDPSAYTSPHLHQPCPVTCSSSNPNSPWLSALSWTWTLRGECATPLGSGPQTTDSAREVWLLASTVCPADPQVFHFETVGQASLFRLQFLCVVMPIVRVTVALAAGVQ